MLLAGKLWSEKESIYALRASGLTWKIAIFLAMINELCQTFSIYLIKFFAHKMDNSFTFIVDWV